MNNTGSFFHLTTATFERFKETAKKSFESPILIYQSNSSSAS